jgi:hypothetical protein
MRVDRFSPFTYGRDIKVSPQDPNTLYACLSVAASSKDGALAREGDRMGNDTKRWQDMTPDEQTVLIRQISGAVNGLQFRVQDLEEAVKALQKRLDKRRD